MGAQGVAQKTRVVKAKTWDELPDVLEPGVYIVGGRKLTVREPVGKDALRKALARLSRSGTRI